MGGTRAAETTGKAAISKCRSLARLTFLTASAIGGETATGFGADSEGGLAPSITVCGGGATVPKCRSLARLSILATGTVRRDTVYGCGACPKGRLTACIAVGGGGTAEAIGGAAVAKCGTFASFAICSTRTISIQRRIKGLIKILKMQF